MNATLRPYLHTTRKHAFLHPQPQRWAPTTAQLSIVVTERPAIHQQSYYCALPLRVHCSCRAVVVRMEVLRGRIYHRWNLPASQSQRAINHDDHDDGGEERMTGNGHKRSRIASSTNEEDKGRGNQDRDDPKSRPDSTAELSTTPSSLTDLVFVPDGPQRQQHYLLSLPKCLLSVAADAARDQCSVVELTRYTEIRVTLQRCSTPGQSNGVRSHGVAALPAPLLDGIPHHVMLEIHQDGLSVLKQDGGGNIRDKNEGDNDKNEDEPWTLAQIWRKELVDSHLGKSLTTTIPATATNTTTTDRHKRRRRQQQQQYTLVAAVAAVSPIIVWNTSDPNQHFALLELYDPYCTADLTAVLVLKGTRSLTWHTILHPTSSDDEGYVFHNVVSSRWRVPEELLGKPGNRKRKHNGSFTLLDDDNAVSANDGFYNHLKGSIPSRVFVATEKFAVSTVRREVPRRPPRVLMTPHNLVHVRGSLLRDAETMAVFSRSQKATFIHFIDLICDDSSSATGKRRHCRLYLTHYAMSTATQWSLRKGAIIEARNVHKIVEDERPVSSLSPPGVGKAGKWITCGACLRSSLVILQTAGEAATATSRQIEQRGARHGQGSWSSLNASSTSSSDTDQLLRLGTQESRTSRGESRSVSSRKTCLSKIHVIVETWLPYTCWKIRKTYMHYICQQYVDDWVDKQMSHRRPSSSARMQLVNILLDQQDGNQNTSIRRTRLPSRDPYAEFFDHSYSASENGTGGDPNEARVECGCHLSMYNRSLFNTAVPSLVLTSLSHIRAASQGYVASRIRKMLSLSPTHEFFDPIRAGWMGSVSAPSRDLLSSCRNETGDGLIGDADTSSPLFLVGGSVAQLFSFPSNGVAALADSWFQIPVAFSHGDDQAGREDFVVGVVESVSISCLCLGSRANKNEDIGTTATSLSFTEHQTTLPRFGSVDKGGCSIVEVSGFIFVTAIHVQCLQAHLLPPKHKIDGSQDVAFHMDSILVEECLQAPHIVSQSKSTSFVLKGLLVRSYFQSSCHFTISSTGHTVATNSPVFDGSCLQSLDLRLDLEHNTASMIAFNKAMDSHWRNAGLAERQRMLGVIFWALGSSGRTCSLTFGGYEEELLGSPQPMTHTNVFVPLSALCFENGGCVRLVCGHDQLESIRYHQVGVQETSTFQSNSCSTPPFQFVGGKKFFTGMLHRRPQRRNIFEVGTRCRRLVGELCAPPSTAVPICTISHLIHLLCQELRGKGQFYLRPSLTRRISCCRFLGVSYCEVRCTCMKCFRPLVASPVDKKRGTNKNRSYDNDEPTYWHVSPPMGSTTQEQHRTLAAPVADKNEVPLHIRQSLLQCPNKCPSNFFGVKWECSGVIDDGTGQANLYTERDAALTLLGISAEHIDWIEHGLWFVENGHLKVNKTMTPSKELRDKVKGLLARKVTVNPIQLLPPGLRAEYLMEHYCRSAETSRRPLDYYVRSKPLDKKSCHLEHGTLESYFGEASLYRGEAATYKLPRLNLQLMDCGIPSYEG